ncbi:MAG: formylglycine-generating enzyme family protein, partial [Deltaproteobacteria bacterium]|nr:formylglycine-generating enzyme family protein [Deltaproteobacteria bacterium]
ARSGISRVSGKALAAKNKRLAERTVKEADLHYKNESYQRAYDAYVATLTLDPESQWAKVKIQASAVMADKQKAQAKAAPILEQAKAVQVELTGVRSEINRLQADIKAMQQRIRGFEDQKAKQPLWDAQKALSAANIAKLQKESSLISAFFTVLSYDGANPEARRGLSKIYYDRYTAGESENDREAMSFYRSLVLTFDDGRYRTLLEQGGNLTITSDPPADGYYLHRFEEGVDRRLVPLAFDPRTPFPIEGKDDEAEPEAKITPMPSLRAALRFDDADRLDRIGDIELPAGSYLVTIKKGGFMDTRVPVMIRRGESSRITAIRLFREKEVPRGFVYVPKGPCLLGGDHAAPYPLDRNVRDIPGFFVSRHEVTAQEYLAFINDMEKRIPGSAEKYLPRKASKSGPYWKKVGAHYENNFPENWPVLGISWNDARAFCKWMTHRHKREGWVFRLPEEWEWEKAARGVDGRYFPWGNHFDFTFCSMANSKKKKRNGPDPVGSFTPDESVYGVMDMAGNVSEWCHTFYDRQNNIRINRGAAWSYAEADYARCAARNGHSPSAVADFRGFRMVASMPER